MNIIIVGCGKVGRSLVEQLSSENHDISIVDPKAYVVQSMVDMYDVFGIVGNGASYNVLTEVGVEEADLLIAVTNSDELNLLCCLIASRFRDVQNFKDSHGHGDQLLRKRKSRTVKICSEKEFHSKWNEDERNRRENAR